MQPPVPKRKLPLQARAKQTVEVILEAATQILWRSGGDRLTTNRIAERAGVSIGTLYQYFPNKEAILFALIERRCTEGEARIKAALAGCHGEPFDVVVDRTVCAIAATFYVERPLVRRMIARLLLSSASRPFAQKCDPLIAMVVDNWAASSAFDGVPLNEVEYFALSCTLVSTIRASIVEDNPIASRADFELMLRRLLLGFFASRSAMTDTDVGRLLPESAAGAPPL